MAFIKAAQLIILVIWSEYYPALTFVAPALESENEPLLSNLDAIVEHVNRAESSWTAGKNFDSDLSGEELQDLVSNFDPLGDSDKNSCDCGVSAKDLGAEEFDARKKWKSCSSISHIYNQGKACKSSWAVAAAGVITDRQCVATNGTTKSLMSAQHLLSCCGECGNGCNGGWPRKAFQYYQKHGIVTGGEYNSKEGCQPFALEPSNNFNNPGDEDKETPKCSTQCTNSQYSKTMKKDLHFGSAVISPCCCTIKYHLEEGGPLVASMVVYEDFFAYKSGVYRHIWGKKVGFQSVRLLGWGTENGVDYWLAANSWGNSWGDGGFFKILRGKGECSFDIGFTAPIPKIKHH